MSARPPRAQSVVLRLPEGGPALAAVVDYVDDEVLALVLSAPPKSGLSLGGGSAVIEYTTPLGIHRLTGAVSSCAGRPEVLEVRRDHRDDVLQRRGFVRVDAVVTLQITVLDPVRGAGRTTTRNLSGSGLMFLDPFGLEPGTALALALELSPGAAPVRARGHVVREIAKGFKGVQIDSIKHSDRERLVRFVFERERMAMKVARHR